MKNYISRDKYSFRIKVKQLVALHTKRITKKSIFSGLSQIWCGHVKLLIQNISIQRLSYVHSWVGCWKATHKGFCFVAREKVILLIIYAIVRTHSFQYLKGRLAWNLRALAIFKRCWCFHSTMAFCCEVSMQLVWWIMPFLLKNSFISNSTPLSLLRVLIWTLNWVLTRLQKYSMQRRVWDFVFEKIDPSTSRKVINNGEEVLGSIMCSNKIGFPYVTHNNFKNSRACICADREWKTMLFGHWIDATRQFIHIRNFSTNNRILNQRYPRKCMAKSIMPKIW